MLIRIMEQLSVRKTINNNFLKAKYLFFIFLLITNLGLCQKTKIEVKENKGKIIGTQNNDNRKYTVIKNKTVINNGDIKNGILLLNKYLDITKNICFSSQGYKYCNPLFAYNQSNGEQTAIDVYGQKIPLKLTSTMNGHLLLNCKIYSVDGKVISLIEDNVINPAGSNILKQTSTDSSLQVLDQYGIPVLTIQIHKKENTIEAQCVTFDEDGNILLIMSKQGVTFYSVGKPYLLKSQEERDKFWYDCKQKIKEMGML